MTKYHDSYIRTNNPTELTAEAELSLLTQMLLHLHNMDDTAGDGYSCGPEEWGPSGVSWALGGGAFSACSIFIRIEPDHSVSVFDPEIGPASYDDLEDPSCPTELASGRFSSVWAAMADAVVSYGMSNGHIEPI